MRKRRGSAALIVFILSVRGYISVKVRQAILHAALYGGQKWRRHVASVVYYILHKNAGLWRLSARTFTIELHGLTCSPKNNRSSNQVYQLYLAKTRMKQNKQKKHTNNSELTFKVHLAVAIRVEYVDDSLDQRVLLELGQRHELFHAQRSRVIQVEFLKPLA